MILLIRANTQATPEERLAKDSQETGWEFDLRIKYPIGGVSNEGRICLELN
jgi:hypothetical protein